MGIDVTAHETDSVVNAFLTKRSARITCCALTTSRCLHLPTRATINNQAATEHVFALSNSFHGSQQHCPTHTSRNVLYVLTSADKIHSLHMHIFAKHKDNVTGSCTC
jgi:hypothetical protein